MRGNSPLDGLGKGFVLLVVGAVLVAVGLSMGGRWPGFMHWRFDRSGDGFSFERGWERSWGSADDAEEADISRVEIIEGVLPSGLEKIDVSLAAGSLVIRSGDSSAWRALDFPSDGIRTDSDDDSFSFEERDWKGRFSSRQGFRMPKLEITLGPEIRLQDVHLELGAGNVELSDLETLRFSLENGAGSVAGRNITAGSAALETAAGSVVLTAASFDSARIETGAGRLQFEGSLGDRSSVSTGMGSVEMKLSGGADRYFIRFERGLGSVSIDGKSWNGAGNGTAGDSSAPATVNLKTGLGSIRIDF